MFNKFIKPISGQKYVYEKELTKSNGYKCWARTRDLKEAKTKEEKKSLAVIFQ